MKFVAIITLTSIIILTGCTPEIRETWYNEKRKVENYNYAQPVKELIGYEKAKEERIPIEEHSCVLYPPSNRVITYNGVEDETLYSQCLPAFYLDSQPIRLEDR